MGRHEDSAELRGVRHAGADRANQLVEGLDVFLFVGKDLFDGGLEKVAGAIDLKLEVYWDLKPIETTIDCHT